MDGRLWKEIRLYIGEQIVKDTSETAVKMDTDSRIAAGIAKDLAVKEWQVAAVIDLIDGGSTIPFIARYRKEATGALDDETLRALDERLRYLRNLEERKQTVLSSIEEQGKLPLNWQRKSDRQRRHLLSKTSTALINQSGGQGQTSPERKDSRALPTGFSHLRLQVNRLTRRHVILMRIKKYRMLKQRWLLPKI